MGTERSLSVVDCELCARRRPERDWGRLAGGELVSWIVAVAIIIAAIITIATINTANVNLTLVWNTVFSSAGTIMPMLVWLVSCTGVNQGGMEEE